MEDDARTALRDIVLDAAMKARARVPTKVVTRYRLPRWAVWTMTIETGTLLVLALAVTKSL